ncbi:hypothetical protein Dvar_11860 [Desulfosarcina variabilis str. Montpellier]|uniref:hypothetical protein n=1 Tax=Desulfosarcina variabilis TaxID=2300 RepID=UPI003AFA2DA8
MNTATRQRGPGSRPKGRILKIKSGFNPNSSSVGSDIPAFFFAALGSGALGIMVLQMIDVYDRYLRNQHGEQSDK